MDPQAAWDQLLAAFADGDWDTIEERATDLLAWLNRDGFPPTVLNAELGHEGTGSESAGSFGEHQESIEVQGVSARVADGRDQ